MSRQSNKIYALRNKNVRLGQSLFDAEAQLEVLEHELIDSEEDVNIGIDNMMEYNDDIAALTVEKECLRSSLAVVEAELIDSRAKLDRAIKDQGTPDDLEDAKQEVQKRTADVVMELEKQVQNLQMKLDASQLAEKDLQDCQSGSRAQSQEIEDLKQELANPSSTRNSAVKTLMEQNEQVEHDLQTAKDAAWKQEQADEGIKKEQLQEIEAQRAEIIRLTAELGAATRILRSSRLSTSNGLLPSD